MTETRTGIVKKYAWIDIAGTRALYQEGAISKFTGFPESLRNRLNVALKFTPESELVLKERVLDPLKAVGTALGIEFILAERDFPIHTTLLEGLYEGTNVDERQEIFTDLFKSETFGELDNLAGKDVVYNYVLIDKGNLLLTAIQIPDWIFKTRGQLTAAYRNQGLKPLGMDILHISLARMTKLPEEDRSGSFSTYKKEISRLRHQISSDPITLDVSSVSQMSAFDLLKPK